MTTISQAKSEITEQDRFTDLVTFVWKYGEKDESYEMEMWSLTLKEDECSESACLTFAYLTFAPEIDQVVLTVEKEIILEKAKVLVDTYDEYGTIYIPEGSREVDHTFYTSYFDEDSGAFSPLPNIIVHSVVILSVENVLLHMETEADQVMEKKGYENEEWTYWIEKFYEYRLEVLSRGEAI
jgi:hypothetical protein